MSDAGPTPAPTHELSIDLIEMEGDIFLWQTQMTREIRLNPLGSRPVNRADSKVASRADNKGNPINRPDNNRARCGPGSKGNEAAGWLDAVPCLRSVQAPS
jgi:hypothetical protein